jgi:excisionase family DNA binding protein
VNLGGQIAESGVDRRSDSGVGLEARIGCSGAAQEVVPARSYTAVAAASRRALSVAVSRSPSWMYMTLLGSMPSAVASSAFRRSMRSLEAKRAVHPIPDELYAILASAGYVATGVTERHTTFQNPCNVYSPAPLPAPLGTHDAVTAPTSGVERVLYSPVEAARALGVGRSTVYVLMDKGELRSVRVGHSRRIPVAEVVAFVHRLLSGSNQPAGATVKRGSLLAASTAQDRFDRSRDTTSLPQISARRSGAN